MGILFLTTKQERCSDLLLWSAAWLLPLLPSLPLSLPSPPLPLLPPPSLPLPLLLPLLLLPLTLSLPPPSLPTLLPPLPLATLVLDTPVLATLVLAMELTLTARGPLMLSPRLMPTMPPTELTPTPDSATDTLDSATASVLVLEPTELTELTTVNFAQQQKLNTVSTVSSPVMGVGHLVLSGERESCLV